MMTFEVRRCIRCGQMMHVVEGSDRTTPKRVWFRLRCDNCGREEMDWHERRKDGKSI